MDARARMFIRAKRDRRRRELLRKMKIWLREMGKRNETNAER